MVLIGWKCTLARFRKGKWITKFNLKSYLRPNQLPVWMGTTV